MEDKSVCEIDFHREDKCIYEFYFQAEAKNFEKIFNKQTNEAFAAKVLQNVFSFQTVRHGIHGKEADLIFDENESFEITLICDKQKRDNLIQRIQGVRRGQGFFSEVAEKEILKYIPIRIEEKKVKSYRTESTNLCLISPLPIIDWAKKKDVIYFLFNTGEHELERLCEKYIEETFKNIYILFPSIDADWWIIDIKENKKYQYRGDKRDPQYPYFIKIASKRKNNKNKNGY